MTIFIPYLRGDYDRYLQVISLKEGTYGTSLRIMRRRYPWKIVMPRCSPKPTWKRSEDENKQSWEMFEKGLEWPVGLDCEDGYPVFDACCSWLIWIARPKCDTKAATHAASRDRSYLCLSECCMRCPTAKTFMFTYYCLHGIDIYCPIEVIKERQAYSIYSLKNKRGMNVSYFCE